jgi:hypothetical protein
MPIIGFNLNGIEGKRTKDTISGEISLNSTPKITNVKEVDLPALKKKALSMEFEFVTSYEPKMAEIKISGNVLYYTENNEPILSEWKKNKKLPDEVSIEVLNHLFRRCLIKAAVLADELQLPPPVNLPVVKRKSEVG